MKRRRECRILSKSDLLTAFENANTRIISKFSHSSHNLCGEGVALLRKLTAQFLRQETNILADFATFQPFQHVAPQHPEPSMMKKPMEEPAEYMRQDDERITFSQSQEQRGTCRFGGDFSQKKVVFESAVANKGIDSTTKKLSKSFKKLGLDERFYEEEEEDGSENNNHINLPNFQGMSILQIMEESNRKVEQRMLEREAHEDSDDSYPITEYSSNDSSNDNDYEAEYRERESFVAESTTTSNNYKPSNILCSPIKSKSQAKEKRRLYIREKRIPKWADDPNKLDRKVVEQRSDPNIDPDSIYGICVVEHLNTNVIFNSDIKFYRGSSAKWNRNLINQFVT